MRRIRDIYHIAYCSVASIMILLLISACGSEEGDGNTAPTLEYIGINKDTMLQSDPPIDSIVVRLLFEDIDGDIAGIISNEPPPGNIYRVDTRDGNIDIASFPAFPELSKGQKGRMDLTILGTCCIFPVIDPCSIDPDVPVNQYSYEIYIEDSKGNRSNTITTDPITLLCR